MKIRAVVQFFEAGSGGRFLQLFDPGKKEPLHTFNFRGSGRAIFFA